MSPITLGTIWEDDKVNKMRSANGKPAWRCEHCGKSFAGHNAVKAMLHVAKKKGEQNQAVSTLVFSILFLLFADILCSILDFRCARPTSQRSTKRGMSSCISNAGKSESGKCRRKNIKTEHWWPTMMHRRNPSSTTGNAKLHLTAVLSLQRLLRLRLLRLLRFQLLQFLLPRTRCSIRTLSRCTARTILSLMLG